MTWLVLIVLGMIPWAIAVERLMRGRGPAGDARVAAQREFEDALRRMTAPGPVSRLDSRDTIVAAEPPRLVAVPSPAIPDTRKENAMPDPIPLRPDLAPPLPPGLSIIEGFVPGDDLLELTLDEDEVAAAEAAGIRLDVKVEQAKIGPGSLVTVGGTPLAFIRGNARVTPRDVILRVEKTA